MRASVFSGLLLAAFHAQPVPESPAPGDVPESRLAVTELAPAQRASLRDALRKHDYVLAENMLAEAAALHAKSQALLLLLGDVLFLDGKQLNSILVLKKAELLGPLDERSRYLLALGYVSIGHRNLAIPEFEKLAASHPSAAQYPYWLARLMYRKTDFNQALLYAKKAVQLDPSFAKAYDQLGLCYGGLGMDTEAIQSYRTAIQLSEQQALRWPWPALNLGTLYLRLNRLPEAEEALSQSLILTPNFPPAHFRLGQVFEKKGDLERAVRELQKSVELDPTYPDPHYALARIYRRRKDNEAADRELKTFVELRGADTRKGTIRPD